MSVLGLFMVLLSRCRTDPGIDTSRVSARLAISRQEGGAGSPGGRPRASERHAMARRHPRGGAGFARPPGPMTGGRAHMPRASTRGSDTRDFDRRVRQVVAARLAGGPLDVHLVAESVRTSPRTLQRRLRGAGLTYARVVQQVRLEIARQMLRDPKRKIRDA